MVRFLLFLSAYAPLFAITAIRFDTAGVRIGSAALAVCGVVAFGWVRIRRGRLASQPRQVVTAEDEGAAVAAYTATYILPFVTVSTPSTADILAYVVFYALLALLHVRTTLVQVNPMLYLAGRRVWRFTDPAGQSAFAIVPAATTLRAGTVLHGVPWSSEVLWIERTSDD